MKTDVPDVLDVLDYIHKTLYIYINQFQVIKSYKSYNSYTFGWYRFIENGMGTQ